MVGFAAAPVSAAATASYPRMHIRVMGMHADRRSVAPHERFSVTVRIVIAEKRDRLDELVLGAVDDCTIVGDERRHAALPGGGTEFKEVLTLEAGDPGTATITPAYIDAVDPANGRALRYSTDPVSVTVTAAEPVDRTYRSLLDVARAASIVLGAAGLLAGALAVARRRRSAPPAPAAAPLPLPPLVPASPPGLAALAAQFARSREERDLLALRSRLFDHAGAAAGATLADALAGCGTQVNLRAALIAAEAAAFGPRDARASAAELLIAAVAAVDGGGSA
jgi:hypothetical protein